MATLTQLAAEYRQSAELLKQRIDLLTGQLEALSCEMERLRMRTRLYQLGCMYRQACDTAWELERYYDRKEAP